MGQKFGQHFLSDKEVLAKIAETALWLQKEMGSTALIEVWPWQWALTKLIIDSFEDVILLEIDTTMEKYLDPLVKKHQDAKIVWGDVLKVESGGIEIETWESKVDDNVLIVWNLPYYITSPIFRKFFVEGSHVWGVFLIQKEVAQKIKTITKQKSYLRWLLNYSYDIEYNFLVSATSFTPPPKVQSAVVSFRKKEQLQKIDFNRMVEFLDIVSQYTRKTLRKIWKMREEDLESFIYPQELELKRVQELTRDEIAQILKK